jgi:hypothetical protein
MLLGIGPFVLLYFVLIYYTRKPKSSQIDSVKKIPMAEKEVDAYNIEMNCLLEEKINEAKYPLYW